MTRPTANEPATAGPARVNENRRKLQSLFPEAFAEGAIDVAVLKQLLGEGLTDRTETYGLHWHGKQQARQAALTPAIGTLRPCPADSVAWDTTRNLLIEGDNLDVLRLLQESHAGQVKVIYIDPPYNTGKDFVYSDTFHDTLSNYLNTTGQVDSNGKKAVPDLETSGRFHTDWLNMMYPRLKLARELLCPDGMIAVSIGDKEVARARLMLEEIFGEANFLCQFSWRTDGNFDNQAKFKLCHEYILLFARDAEAFPHPPVVDPGTPPDSKLFNPTIRNTIIKNGPKNPVSPVTLPAGFPADFTTGVIAPRDTAWPHFAEPVEVRNGCLVHPVEMASGWSSKALLLSFIKGGCRPIRDGKNQETTFVLSRTGAIEAIKQRPQVQSHVISVLQGLGGSQKAAAQLAELGAVFDGYPKPIELIRYFLQMNVGTDYLVLDFFAGSGTTGHAVMAQNAADGGTRRFILVQRPEPLDPAIVSQKSAAAFCDRLHKPRTIAELTKERLRRAGRQIAAAKPSYEGNDGDVGFRVFTFAAAASPGRIN